MADVRCPMCGKPNPPERENCQHCQARLKPLYGSTPPETPGGAAKPPRAHTGLTDWLTDLRAGEEGAGYEASSEKESFAQEETDWLERLGQPAESAPAPKREAPDWLATPTSGGDPNIPDWIEELGVQPQSASQEEINQPAEPSGDEPDWLKRIRARQSTETPAPPASDTPDWLTSLEQGSPNAFASTGLDAEAAPPAAEPETPDWLNQIGSGTPAQQPASTVPAFILDDSDTLALTGDEQPLVDLPADLETLPDWLSTVRPDEPAPHTAQPAAEQPSDLTPAQLPGWLEAMRPVEAAAPSAPYKDETDTRVESAGPLAGLRGALPAEAEVARFHKPPIYSIKLQLNADQQARVTMLEEMLAQEGQARPVLARPAITSQALLRLAIALALILAVVYTLWVGGEQVSMPAGKDIPAGVLKAQEQINQLQAGSPILVVFDYEPGYRAELEAAAGELLTHTINQGAFLTLVSSSPTGAALAEGVISAHFPAQEVNTPARYANLGYIPGGAAGLRAFAAGPRKTMPYALNGEDVWAGAALGGVQTISDFAMLVVLTENPDTARAWVEQTGLLLETAGKPLVMVVSAQAAPLLQPFTTGSAPLVDGLVSGLEGGAAYESLRGASGAARRYWDAFSAALFAAGLLIVGGALVNTFSGALAVRKQTQKEEAQV